MNGGPKFSIVIPTHNRLGLLKQALNSIWAQTIDDYEIIIVDDGSTDGTAQWLATQCKSVSTFTQANRGPGAARNLGAGHACGAYLAFLDSDDLWFPWTLEVYREVIRAHNDPSFLAGKPYVFCVDHELDNVRSATVKVERFADYFASADRSRWWGASSFIIRRDAFVEVGGFTDKWVNAEDADLALRLGVAGNFVQITSPVTFAYRKHTASVSGDIGRIYAGACLMVSAEEAGQYPGGRARALERRRILTRHTRPVVLGCLEEGLRYEAWMLYRATFAWNAALRRGRYLAAFPILAALSRMRERRPPSDAEVLASKENQSIRDA